MVHIDEILKDMVARKGSDLHLKVGRPPMMRVAGSLLPSEFAVVTHDEMYNVILQLADQKTLDKYREEMDADFAYAIKDLARFRVNALHQMGEPGAVLRTIPLKIPTVDSLNLPPVIKDIVAKPQGLILVTGPTGSGKSTTLAAMIQQINETEACHIMTIEDPVEFVYTDKLCTINQRQIGQDVKSFTEALRRALRQDPDVILMGELRDQETIEIAMHAAETGHLVFGTLHTNDAKQSMDRIIDTFPAGMHSQVRSVLSLVLEAVISQRLVKKADGTGRVGACEVMIASPQVRELIKEGRINDIEKAMMKAGSYYRMQTFNQCLAQLALDNVITQEDALSTSSTPDDLRLLLKGISTSGTQAGTGAAASQSKVIKPEGAEAPKPPEETKPKVSRGFNFGTPK